MRNVSLCSTEVLRNKYFSLEILIWIWDLSWGLEFKHIKQQQFFLPLYPLAPWVSSAFIKVETAKSCSLIWNSIKFIHWFAYIRLCLTRWQYSLAVNKVNGFIHIMHIEDWKYRPIPIHIKKLSHRIQKQAYWTRIK